MVLLQFTSLLKRPSLVKPSPQVATVPSAGEEEGEEIVYEEHCYNVVDDETDNSCNDEDGVLQDNENLQDAVKQDPTGHGESGDGCDLSDRGAVCESEGMEKAVGTEDGKDNSLKEDDLLEMPERVPTDEVSDSENATVTNDGTLSSDCTNTNFPDNHEEPLCDDKEPVAGAEKEKEPVLEEEELLNIPTAVLSDKVSDGENATDKNEHANKKSSSSKSIRTQSNRRLGRPTPDTMGGSRRRLRPPTPDMPRSPQENSARKTPFQPVKSHVGSMSPKGGSGKQKHRDFEGTSENDPSRSNNNAGKSGSSPSRKGVAGSSPDIKNLTISVGKDCSINAADPAEMDHKVKNAVASETLRTILDRIDKAKIRMMRLSEGEEETQMELAKLIEQLTAASMALKKLEKV